MGFDTRYLANPNDENVFIDFCHELVSIFDGFWTSRKLDFLMLASARLQKWKFRHFQIDTGFEASLKPDTLEVGSKILQVGGIP